jgi:hypothetical protein
VERLCHGNVFNGSLPSNGHTRHNILWSPVLYRIVFSVFIFVLKDFCLDEAGSNFLKSVGNHPQG